MRRAVFTLVLVLASTLFAVAQQKQSAPAADKDISAAVNRWLELSQQGSESGMEKLIADDFIGTGFGGNVLSKEDVIPRDRQHLFTNAEIHDLETRMLGDTAIAVGSVVFKNGNPAVRFTEVWNKRGGTWQLVAAHLSRS